MDEERLSYKELLAGDIPPWVMRFVKGVGKAVSEYNMIQDGDRVLIAASGGKDSLALALALSLRRKWLPVNYTLEAVMIDWLEHPIPGEYREKLKLYFEDLGIPLTILDETQFPTSKVDNFDCYLCSRNRRKILFQWADQHGFKLVAMGHHLDDLVETTMMNLCFRAKFSSMLPVQEFFEGKMHIIRPMIEIKENVTSRLAVTYDIPVIKPVCPYDQTNVRARLKPIVKELCHIDKLTREHIYNSHHFDCALPKKETVQRTEED